MKLNSRQLNRTGTRLRLGFTLIEMIGVLAVIAILAAVLVPKVFEAINNAKVNNAAMSINTAKTAIADHYAKFGSLASSNGIALTPPLTNFDNILVTEGFMDKPFSVKISATSGTLTNHVEVIAAVPATQDPTAANAVYNLDNTGAAGVDRNKALGSAVAQCVIPGVTENDAKDLNDRLDGTTLGVALGSDDLIGRVKYATPGTNATTTVYVYLTHR